MTDRENTDDSDITNRTTQDDAVGRKYIRKKQTNTRQIPDLPDTHGKRQAASIDNIHIQNIYEDPSVLHARSLDRNSTRNMENSDSRRKGVPEIPADVDDNYYNSTLTTPEDSTPSTFSSGPYKSAFHSKNFFQGRDGRYLFPFLEAKQAYMSAEDEEVNNTYIPGSADKADVLFLRIWREAFAALRAFLSLVFLFAVEFVRFLSHDIFHTVVMRIVAILGDFIIKPLFSGVFNCIIMPSFVLIWNVLGAARLSLGPIFTMLSEFSDQIVKILRAFRLVEITYNVQSDNIRHKVQQI